MSMKTMMKSKMKIKRLNYPTQDDVGGIVQTKSSETTVKCRVRQLSAVETSISGRDGVYSTHRVYCPVGTKIAPKDEVVIGSSTYDVNVVQDVHELGKVFQVDVTLRS